MNRKWQLLFITNLALLVLFYFLGESLHNWLNTILPLYSEFFLKNDEAYLQSAAKSFALLFQFTGAIIALIVSLFLSSVQISWKLGGRLFRSGCLAALICVLAFITIIASAFLFTLVVNTNTLEFIGNIFFGLSTELIGALITFLLLDTFAKTWEENEESDNSQHDELKTLIGDLGQKHEKSLQDIKQNHEMQFAKVIEQIEKHEIIQQGQESELKRKLQILIAELEEKAKSQEAPSFQNRNRLRPIQKGRIEAYNEVINAIQKLTS